MSRLFFLFFHYIYLSISAIAWFSMVCGVVCASLLLLPCGCCIAYFLPRTHTDKYTPIAREPRISNEKCTNFNESFMNISRCTFFRIFHQCRTARIDNVFTIDKCNSGLCLSHFYTFQALYRVFRLCVYVRSQILLRFASVLERIWNEFVFCPVAFFLVVW